jgi:hypothetical protein
MNIVSFAEARAAGLTHYFSGSECLNGHLSPRRVGNRQCIECDKQRKLLKNKAQYQKHREKRLQKAAEYRAINREKLIAKASSYITTKRRADPLYAMKTTISGQIFISMWVEKICENVK